METNHAIANARSWLSNIREMLTTYDAASAAWERDEADGDAVEAARTAIEEGPLSVQVRDGWRAPDAPSLGPTEYEILLTTGGPALRIVGDLDDDCEPTNVLLQWQDWGTPWTGLQLTDDEPQALLRFARFFWFGGAL